MYRTPLRYWTLSLISGALNVKNHHPDNYKMKNRRQLVINLMRMENHSPTLNHKVGWTMYNVLRLFLYLEEGGRSMGRRRYMYTHNCSKVNLKH